jgi:beta-glucosidase-like glycosyl hydrolase
LDPSGAGTDDADAGNQAGPEGNETGPNGPRPSGTSDGPNGGGPTPNGSGPSGSDNRNAPQFDCSEVRSQQFDGDSMAGYGVPQDVADAVESTLQLMTPTEKATQMMGVDGAQRNYRDIMRTSDIAVAGVGVIRGFRFRDGGRGVDLETGQDNRTDDGNNFATVFPTESLRAASWDVELERRIGAAIGDEAAASKNNALIAPSVNIVRHPYWGRVQESYGEDSYLVGRMATAFTVGAQEYVMACAKHFAAYGIEKNRSAQNALLTEQTLREIYTRQFEMVVQDGGVGCVLAAYHLVNGVKSTQNRQLLRNVLKAPVAEGGMGFEGLVITDWWAMPGDQNPPDPATAQATTNEAVLAGTDIELPWALHYDTTTLANADAERVEEAARRILTQKFRFNSALDTDPWSLEPPTSPR